MMAYPERSPERDAAVMAVLEHVPDQGWSMATLRTVLADPYELGMLFPGGSSDLIETFCDLADREMEAAAAGDAMDGLGLTKRVRRVIEVRLHWLRPHREAMRRALAVLIMPQNACLSLRITHRTVDAIWHAASDRSADFSWYTKRAILAAIYSATLLFWLGDNGEDDAATLAFLDRRLAGVGHIGKLRARLSGMVSRKAGQT